MIYSKQETWDDWEKVKALLIDRMLSGQYATVLGAGASMGCGLPSWTHLVNTAYGVVGQSRIATHDDNMASEHLLVRILGEDRRRFASTIQKALYESFNEKAALQHPMLEAIAAVVMLSARRRSGTVITYNFDDLLETYLRYRGFYAYPVIEQPSWHENEDVTVLHPHGFLSRFEELPSSETITFTQLDFDRQTGQVRDPWRKKTLDILERNMPLFIGLSGNDQNLRSILEESKSNHVATKAGHLYWGIRLCVRTDANIDLWRNRGVWCVTADTHEEIPNLLMDICKSAADVLAKRPARDRS